MVTTTSLRSRFNEELQAIDAYVTLLQDRAFVSAKEVVRLIRILEEFKIIKEKPELKLVPGLYTLEELHEVHDFVQLIRPALDETFKKAEADLLSIEEPADLANTDVRSFEGECIQFVLDALEAQQDPVDFELIEQELREQIKDAAESQTEVFGEAYQQSDEDHFANFAIRSAIFLRARAQANSLADAIEIADEIEANLRIMKKEATVNVFRQGFILLMTIFDATIFDLMRLALRRNFFELIGTIAKQDRLSFDKFANHSSFESFRDEIIEEKLKAKYLKDILFFERFSFGDFADIDETYWSKAKLLSSNCVDKVCTWVETLPEP